MTRSRSILMSCLVLLGAVAGPPSGVLAREQPREVRTQRSDGAVFPAVRQRARAQQSRAASITASVQALPARGSWQSSVEPPGGGDGVAPAGTGPEAGPVAVGVVIEAPARREAPPVRPPRPRTRN